MAVESAAFGIVVTPFFTVSFSKWQSVPANVTGITQRFGVIRSRSKEMGSKKKKSKIKMKGREGGREGGKEVGREGGRVCV
eukprot:461302-Rhodomonas_salina.2